MSTAQEIRLRMAAAYPTMMNLQDMATEALKNAIVPVRGNYWAAVSASLERELNDIIARERWKEFYRAVRILRRLRGKSTLDFARMSHLWYESALRREYLLAEPAKARRERFAGKVGSLRARRLP